MKNFHEFQLRGMRVVKRVDINSPIEGGRIVLNPRLQRHGESIRKLSDAGAKLIVLAHQGREGNPDFVGLSEHARLLERIVQRQIEFVPSTDPEQVKAAIGRMQNGDILLLENVRMWEGELGAPSESLLVKTLAPMADLFVLDSLSVSHREHASVIGLTGHVPSAVGPVLRRELDALSDIEQGDATLILGGGKVRDSLSIMGKWLEQKKARKVLLGGAISVLFIEAAGHNVADTYSYLQAKGLLDYTKGAKDLLFKYKEAIVLPEDVGLNIDGSRVEARVGAIEKGRIQDIGENTISRYSEEIFASPRIIMNGPMGTYEEEGFGLGTKKVLEAIAQSSAHSLIGGGHTISAISKNGIPHEKFGYVSLSGKALINYLSGKELPALSALKGTKV
ncbi:phosphoglycerate kinase [Candidatus Micrarchaeota archaeon]|nr:phosphoglycerate kinase [Candidatus Micrarchaeota archaeon]